MGKIVVDGKVAVILARGIMNNWYTEHGEMDLVFDPIIIQTVLQCEEAEGFVPSDVAFDIEQYCDDTFGARDWWGDTTELTVHWVEEGSEFTIKEIDNFETIVYKKDNINWMVA